VNVVDANVLLYAVTESAEHHEQARDWLDGALNGRSSQVRAWFTSDARLAALTIEHPGVWPLQSGAGRT